MRSSISSSWIAGLAAFVVLSAGTDVCAQEATAPADGPVYIAYAGPYASSPPSAFGHLFLVLPRDSAEPLPLWDVVSFSAETNGAGPLEYMRVGIWGGFSGRYERLDFHEKTRDYELLDDRDLWLTEVVLTPGQRRSLADALAATEGRWYPYTFFERNCAYYLQVLLSQVLDALPQPDGPTSPTEVYELVEREAGGASYFRPAASRGLEEGSNELTPAVRQRLRAEEWDVVARDTVWLKTLTANDRRFVQEYFGWKWLQRGSALADDVARGIALLRLLNARDVAVVDGGTPDPAPGQRITQLQFHGYPRASVSFIERASGPRVAFGFRPAMHDRFDPWRAHRPLNTLEFLSIDASVSADGNELSPRIESVVLFAQRSLNPSSWIAPRRSWMLEVLAARGGVFDEGVHGAARAGGGKTFGIGGSAFFYGLLTTAVVSDGDDLAFAPGLEIGTLVLPSRSWRLGARWTREHDLFDWSNRHERIEGWIRYDIGTGWGVRAMAAQDETGGSLRVGVDWYP